MRPASHHSATDPPGQEPPACDAPFLLIDPAAAVLLGANRAGWQAWGLDPDAVAPPVAIDAAMPALQRLRAWAAMPLHTVPAHETLMVWTACGLRRLTCWLEPATNAGDGVLMVRIRAWEAVGTVRSVVSMPSHVAHASAHGDASAVGCACGRPWEAHDASLDAFPDVSPNASMIARLAHEIRTPLGAVIAYAEILKSEHFGPLTDARYQRYARDIHESARHALGVVDGMLRGEAAGAGLSELAFADLDPASIIESCLVVARPLAQRAGLQLGAQYAPRLPRVVADELSLKQMLLNLLANAIKFARRGDRVTVAVAHEGDGPLRIWVADTGPGMALDASASPLGGAGEDAREGAGGDARERRLRQARRAAAAPDLGLGLGLGLPLTKALAAANGAVLAIESTLGKGTCVTISFGKERLVPV